MIEGSSGSSLGALWELVAVAGIQSSCCPGSESYDYEEDQGNKKELEELIDDNESEDELVLNLNTQRASPQQKTQATESGLVVLIDRL